jgi:hypothetical protein
MLPRSDTDHPYTITQLIACVDREIHLRKVVYPKRIKQSKMHPGTAQVEIEKMEAVKVVLEGVAEGMVMMEETARNAMQGPAQ